MPASDKVHAIEVRVEEVAQLFDTLDPFPFRERDLDEHAEEYIVGWARELPRHQPMKIVIHAPESELQKEDAAQLGAALGRYFNYRAEITGRDLKELFRVGRLSLLIGVAVLTVCVLTSRAAIEGIGDGSVIGIMKESLIILGWVANWKPIEIFLYDWWPLARRRNLYRRLAAASVELRPYQNAMPAAPSGNALGYERQGVVVDHRATQAERAPAAVTTSATSVQLRR